MRWQQKDISIYENHKTTQFWLFISHIYIPIITFTYKPRLHLSHPLFKTLRTSNTQCLTKRYSSFNASKVGRFFYLGLQFKFVVNLPSDVETITSEYDNEESDRLQVNLIILWEELRLERNSFKRILPWTQIIKRLSRKRHQSHGLETEG